MPFLQIIGLDALHIVFCLATISPYILYHRGTHRAWDGTEVFEPVESMCEGVCHQAIPVYTSIGPDRSAIVLYAVALQQQHRAVIVGQGHEVSPTPYRQAVPRCRQLPQVIIGSNNQRTLRNGTDTKGIVWLQVEV